MLDQSSNTIISLWKKYHKYILIYTYLNIHTYLYIYMYISDTRHWFFWEFRHILVFPNFWQLKGSKRWVVEGSEETKNFRFSQWVYYLFYDTSLIMIPNIWVIQYLSTFKQTDLATFLDFVDCTIVPNHGVVMILVKRISYRISSNEVLGLSCM